MRLTFERSNGEEVELGNYETADEAAKKIQSYLDERNFHSYYWRITEQEDKRIYDVGSWSEFFYLYK